MGMIDLRSKNISNVILSRVLGLILFALSIVEFYVGAHIRGFIFSSFGAFYVGVFSFITSVSALSSYNGYTVVITCVFSALSVIVGILGTSLDGIGVVVFSSIEACLDSSFNYYPANGYATSKYQAENVLICASSIAQNYASNNCYCISTFNSTVIITADGSQKELSGCWVFGIHNDDLDCGGLVNMLPNYLKASAAICAAIIFFSLVTSVITCCTLYCCKKQEPIGILSSTTLNQPLRGVVINQI